MFERTAREEAPAPRDDGPKGVLRRLRHRFGPRECARTESAGPSVYAPLEDGPENPRGYAKVAVKVT
jgi:hypothetical protein